MSITDDIRLDIGDDGLPSGDLTSPIIDDLLLNRHYLLSSTHIDTVAGSPTSPSLIISNSQNKWTILPSGEEGSILGISAGQISFISAVSGIQGPQGPAGPSGAQGVQGDPGPSGAQGIQGDPGPSGADGAQGPAGPSGATGPSGAQGIQGDPGPSGATGPSGADGAQGPPGPIVGWSGVLNVNNWSGPYDVVTEQTLYSLGAISIASGNQVLWAVNASGNIVAGVMASGSGYIKITDGSNGVGHILFNSHQPNVWDPLPYDITQALDWLAIATGIPGPSGATGPQGPIGPSGATGPSGDTGPSGATGPQGPAGADGAQGPPGPIVGWSGVLNVNNWSGPYQTIHEQAARFFDNIVISSGVPILWTNISSPSGGYQAGIIPSGSGFIKITDGWNGNGHILFFSRQPSIWTPVPTDVTQALDYLAQATGVLAGATGSAVPTNDALAEITARGNWSSITDIVTQGRAVVSGNVLLPSSGIILWSADANPSGTPKVAILSPSPGIISVSGNIAYYPANAADWNTGVPTTVGGALDLLVTGTGVGGGGGSAPQSLNQVLARGNWSGPIPIVAEHAIYASSGISLSSGNQLAWSNITSPSGGPQVGIIASGSGVIKITDGYNGIGHILYSPSTPVDWSAPVPTTLDGALDALAKATGILAGGTGNPPQIVDGLSETTNAGSWSSETNVVILGNTITSGNVLMPSSGLLVWSNSTNPSGSPKVLIYSPSDGIVQISGHLAYVPTTSADWPQVPSTVTNALDQLAKATGVLAGNSGNPTQPIEALMETLSAGNWSGPVPIVAQHGTYIASGIAISSGVPLLWSNIASPSGGAQLGIVASGSGILKVTDGWSGYGKIFYSPTNTADWSAPTPNTIEAALDALAKATGVLAGGTGNPPVVVDGLAETTAAGNWSSETSVVVLGNTISSGNLLMPSSGLIVWSTDTNPSGTPKVVIYSPNAGIVQISGHLAYVPTTAADWNTGVPTTVTQALDYLAAATGTGGGGSQPQTLGQVLSRGNWSGPISIVAQHGLYAASGIELASGVPLLWSNVASPSGGAQLGVVASGSGILKVTDGWDGYGKIYYSPTIPTDWSAPTPNTIESALDALAKATGILAGGTGNPIQPTEALMQTLVAGNWSGPVSIVAQHGLYAASGIGIASGLQLLWSNIAAPSGGPQLGIVASGSGVLRITNGYTGDGYIFYSPTTPADWETGTPATIQRALDLLAASTGIAPYGPTTDALAEVVNRGEWSGPKKVVFQSGIASLNEIGIASGLQIKFGSSASGSYVAGIDIYDSTSLKITNATNGLASLVVAPNSLYIGDKVLATGIALSAPINGMLLVRTSNNSPATLSVPGSGVSSEQFGWGANAASNYTLAIGYRALASGQNNIAIGPNANSSTSVQGSIAIGPNALANPGSCVVIGNNAGATSNGAGGNQVVIGPYASGQDVATITIGVGAQSSGDYAITIGAEALNHSSSIVIGPFASGGQGSNIVIGNNARTLGLGNVCIGWLAGNGDQPLNSYYNVAIGYNATAGSGFSNIQNSIAIGRESRVGGATNAGRGIAIGYRSFSVTTDSIGIGSDAVPSGASAITIGASATANAADTIVIGRNAYANANATNSVVLGNSAGAVLNHSQVVIGLGASGQDLRCIAIGRDTIASGDDSVCIGTQSKSLAVNNVCIGFNTQSIEGNNVIIGHNAITRGGSNVIIGANAGRGTEVNQSVRNVCIGWGATVGSGFANLADTIAIGSNAIAGGGTNATYAMSFGSAAYAVSSSSQAFGAFAMSSGKYSMALGHGSNAYNQSSTLVGGFTLAGSLAQEACAFGFEAAVTNRGAISIGYQASGTAINSIAIGKTATASHIKSIAIGDRARTIGNQILTIGCDEVGISAHVASGYLRVGHLHDAITLASGDIWGGGHNQSWLWYNQDSGSLRIADSQGNGIIELNAQQSRIICSGDVVYTEKRIAGMDVFTTNATIRRELSVFRHSASTWPVASLPSVPVSGQVHTIKDGAGLAATNNIMISGVGKTVDGQNGIPIVNNYGSMSVIYNGTEWSVI